MLFLCFQTADVKMLVKCLQICAHVFINRPQDQILVVHSWKILCRLCTKLCPNFGRSRARLCPISFAPCPFPNLAGTLLLIFKWTKTVQFFTPSRHSLAGDGDYLQSAGCSSNWQYSCDSWFRFVRPHNSHKCSRFAVAESSKKPLINVQRANSQFSRWLELEDIGCCSHWVYNPVDGSSACLCRSVLSRKLHRWYNGMIRLKVTAFHWVILRDNSSHSTLEKLHD